MKTKCLFLILLFQLHHCIGQEVEKVVPYFVMACVENFKYGILDEYKEYPFYLKILYKMENDNLLVVDTLNSSKNSDIIMGLLVQLEEYKLIYFEENSKDNQSKIEYISILDYSNGLKIRRYRPTWDSSYSQHITPHILLINDKIVFNNENNRRQKPRVDYGQDLYFNKYQLRNSDFINIYLEGKAGFERSSLRAFSFHYWKNNLKYLKLSWDSTIYSPYQEPENIKSKFDRDLYVRINNSKYFLTEGSGEYRIDSDTTLELKLYDKHLENWSKINIPGNYTKIKNYKDWLYGTAEYISNGDPNIRSGITPLNYKSKYHFNYGDASDILLYRGILYIYNIPNKKLLQWNTGDRDSEIITIHEGTIYYRVFDEIRTVELDTIKNEINWPSQKLLIKDKKRVPNIHWMFFAPKQDKVEEVWVNRPKGIKE